MLPPILLSIGIFAQIFESSCGVSIGKSEIQEDIAFSCSKIVFKARFYLALVSKQVQECSGLITKRSGRHPTDDTISLLHFTPSKLDIKRPETGVSQFFTKPLLIPALIPLAC